MRLAYLIGLFFSLAIRSLGQDLTDGKKFIDENEASVRQNDNMIVSWRGLNVFFAQNVSKYLSGSSDLSLFSQYVIFDAAEKQVFVGWNLAKDPTKSEQRTKMVYTVGLKAKSADGFASLYSGESFSNELGVSLKMTVLGRGIVAFDNHNQKQRVFRKMGPAGFGQKDWMNVVRNNAATAIKKDADDEAQKFEESIQTIPDNNVKKELREEFYLKANEAMKRKFVLSEAEALAEEKSHWWFWDQWISLEAYVPLTQTQYLVANDLTSKVETQKLYNFSASLMYNMIWDSRKGTLFINGGAGIKNNNGILTDEFAKYSVIDYKNLGGTDTIAVAEINAKQIYVGQYETFITPTATGQIIFLPGFTGKRFGISLWAEKNFGKFDPLNLRIGIPFRITGSSEKPTTFELQARWDDFNGDVEPKSSRSEKFALGFTLGIPFSSKIY